MATCGTCRLNGQVGALGPELDSNLPRGHIGDHARNKKRTDASGSFFEQDPVEVLQHGKAPESRSGKASYPVAVAGRHFETRVFHSHAGRSHGIVDEDIKSPDLLFLQEVLGSEILDLSCYLTRVGGGIKFGYLRDS